MSKEDAANTLNAFIDIMSSNIADGKKIILRGLGSFSPIVRKPKPARIISENKPCFIPARCVVKFTPSIKLKEKVSEIEASKFIL